MSVSQAAAHGGWNKTQEVFRWSGPACISDCHHSLGSRTETETSFLLSGILVRLEAMGVKGSWTSMSATLPYPSHVPCLFFDSYNSIAIIYIIYIIVIYYIYYSYSIAGLYSFTHSCNSICWVSTTNSLLPQTNLHPFVDQSSVLRGQDLCLQGQALYPVDKLTALCGQTHCPLWMSSLPL